MFFFDLVGTIAVLYPTTEQGKAEIKREAVAPKTPRTPYPRLQSPALSLGHPKRRDIENDAYDDDPTPNHENRKKYSDLRQSMR